jgi:SIR2-like domain
MTRFLDEKYVKTIRESLWCRPEYGRAAVMIGSGFSRNADCTSVSVRPLPTWSDLSRSLVERLDQLPDDVGERARVLHQAEESSRALRLGDEFDAALGRSKLNEFLQDMIRDLDYEPGRLHRLLLELPWADVFSTNYDTLLERASRHVVGRRYDVIRTSEEIPRAMRPRIVKLHGTFPSNPPFIFTGEDFRTYPRSFAAFVNLAQQSMMENVFCLLGFSGDDPNFLHWSGWVRDHLGGSAPRIYLCGMLGLSDSQRRFLDRRNVTPIDLSPLFPTDEFPDVGLRHRLAIEWFLLSLEAGRSVDPISWPRMKLPLTTPSVGLPPIIGPAGPPLSRERLHPHE